MQDIISSIGVPKLIKDNFLDGASIVKSKSRSPLMFVGGYNIVFCFLKNGQKWAVRVWHVEIKDSQQRFNEISTYLLQNHIIYFSEFTFVFNGVFVNGQSLPLTRMKWIDGKNLKDFLAENIKNELKLKYFCERFLNLISELHANKISHGDLQHGNIIIQDDGEIRLIDYDSICVPSIEYKIEIVSGLKGYQHPSRFTYGKCSLKADYFSELIIFLSVIAIIENPNLWNKYDVENTEVLLFTAEDFRNFSQSQIKKDLLKLSPFVISFLNILDIYLNEPHFNNLKPFYAYTATNNTTLPSNKNYISPTYKASATYNSKTPPKPKTTPPPKKKSSPARLIIIIGIICFIAYYKMCKPQAAAPVVAPAPIYPTYNYVGSINNSPIHMHLSRVSNLQCAGIGNNFEGYYYYDTKGSNNPVNVKGFNCGTTFYLSENAGSTVLGSFTGKLKGNAISGNWKYKNQMHKFYLAANGNFIIAATTPKHAPANNIQTSSSQPPDTQINQSASSSSAEAGMEAATTGNETEKVANDDKAAAKLLDSLAKFKSSSGGDTKTVSEKASRKPKPTSNAKVDFDPNKTFFLKVMPNNGDKSGDIVRLDFEDISNSSYRSLYNTNKLIQDLKYYVISTQKFQKAPPSNGPDITVALNTTMELPESKIGNFQRSVYKPTLNIQIVIKDVNGGIIKQASVNKSAQLAYPSTDVAVSNITEIIKQPLQNYINSVF